MALFWLRSSRHEISYVVGISILRGLAVPDFRYGLLSVAIIQIVYPLALLLPQLIRTTAATRPWRYLLVGLAGIALSQLVGFGRYALEIGWHDASAPESEAVALLSTGAMIGFFVVLLALTRLPRAAGTAIPKLSRVRMIGLEVAFIAATLGGIALLYASGVYIDYPRHPDPATLRTFPYALKGTVVYVTERESQRLHWLNCTEAGLAAFVIINLVINAKWPLQDRKNA